MRALRFMEKVPRMTLRGRLIAPPSAPNVGLRHKQYPCLGVSEQSDSVNEYPYCRLKRDE